MSHLFSLVSLLGCTINCYLLLKSSSIRAKYRTNVRVYSIFDRRCFRRSEYFLIFFCLDIYLQKMTRALFVSACIISYNIPASIHHFTIFYCKTKKCHPRCGNSYICTHPQLLKSPCLIFQALYLPKLVHSGIVRILKEIVHYYLICYLYRSSKKAESFSKAAILLFCALSSVCYTMHIYTAQEIV